MTTATKTRALTLNVYRAADRVDCTMGGVSARYAQLSIVGTVDHRYPAVLSNLTVTPLPANLSLPEWTPRAEGERYASAPVALIVRNMGNRVLFSLRPCAQDDDGTWEVLGDSHGHWMSGGNLADTSDSRLRELCESFVTRDPDVQWVPWTGGAIDVHDRCEPWR